MSKRTKILALVLAVIMLLGAMPLALFAEDSESTETQTSTTVLDELAAKGTGSLYEGISIPDGATKVYDAAAPVGNTSTKIGKEIKDNVYVDSGYGDGSKVLIDTEDDIAGTTSTATATDITFTIIGETTLSDRFYVASFNIMRGEAYDNYIYRVRINSTGIGTTVVTDSEGNEKSRTENVAAKYDVNICGYHANTNTIYIYKGVNDKGVDVSCGEFGTGYYTNFGIIIDKEQNDAYYYINGELVASDTNFLTVPKTSTSTEDGLTTTTTYAIEKESDLYNKVAINPHYGTNKPIAGVWAQYGKVTAYQTSVVANVFDEEGKFIYENTDPRTGVTKIRDKYYYFEDGKQVFGGTVTTVDGWILELDDQSGEVLSYYKIAKDTYAKMTKAELVEKGATGYNTSYISTLSNKTLATFNGADKITAYRYAEDGTTVETYEIDAIKVIDYKKNDHFSLMKFGEVGSSGVSYYASEANLASGTLTTLAQGKDDLQFFYDGIGADKTYKATNGSNASLRNPDQDFIFSFDAIAGEAVNAYYSSGNLTSTIPFMRARVYYEIDLENTNNSTGKSYNRDDPGIISVEIIDGVPYIYFNGENCGEFSMTEKTNFTLLVKMDDTLGPLVSLYINGELKGSDLQLMTAKGGNNAYNKVNYKILDHYICNFGAYHPQNSTFDGHLFTYYPGKYYVASENYEAVTDGYTGFLDNGTGFIYYENGAIAARGDAATVEAAVGKKYAALDSYNVTLADNIHLNFYTKLRSLATEAGAYALLTVGDKEQKIALNTLVEEDGLYKITAKLSSIQIGKDVKLEIYDSNGNKADIIKDNLSSDSWSYSVQRYAEHIIANPASYTAEAVNAVKAMLTYGAFAERHFAGERGLETMRNLSASERLAVQYGTIGTFYTDISVKTVDKQKIFASTLNDYSDTVNRIGSTTDAELVGAVKLVLNSEIKIRIKLNVTAAPESIEGASLYTETNGDTVTYYLDVTGVTAKQLNDTLTVTVDGETIKISVLAVANAVVSAPEGTYAKTFTDLMKSMYIYYYYTDVYAKSVA